MCGYTLQETAASVQGLTGDERQAQHAAAVAAATAVLSEASASALKDVIAEEGISQEQRAESIAAAREQRMQQLLYAITVLASSSGKRAGRSVGCIARLISVKGNWVPFVA
jgi:hypothetical protein